MSPTTTSPGPSTCGEGIRWSDGEPVTIDDALFSFQAVFHDQIATSIKDGFKHPETGELPQVSIDRDRNAIIFQLSRVDSQFVTHIGAVRLIPHHKWKDHLQDENPTLLQQMTSDAPPEDLVGCGPFVLKNYVPGEKIVYRRNPYYWKKDARGQRLPYLDEVVILLVKDLNLQWQKFEAGELDIFMELPADHFREASAMEKAGKADLVRLGVSLNSVWVCFNLHAGKDAETGEPYVDPAKSYWFHQLEFRQGSQSRHRSRRYPAYRLPGQGHPDLVEHHPRKSKLVPQGSADISLLDRQGERHISTDWAGRTATVMAYAKMTRVVPSFSISTPMSRTTCASRSGI